MAGIASQARSRRSKGPISRIVNSPGFDKGGLHRSTGTPQGQNIPESKVQAALAGRYGKKAQAQARFYVNVLRKHRP